MAFKKCSEPHLALPTIGLLMNSSVCKSVTISVWFVSLSLIYENLDQKLKFLCTISEISIKEDLVLTLDPDKLDC